MKTKISTFIVAIVLLLFNMPTVIAQETKAYFKKDGVTVFESPISDIDSIFFSQASNLFISLNPSDPLLCSYTQQNITINCFGSRDENGIPKELEAVFIEDENDEIVMQIYFDEYERPIKFTTKDNLMFCEYISDDRAIITIVTEEGDFYSAEMEIDIDFSKSYFLKNHKNGGRKGYIQVTNCEQPNFKAVVYVIARGLPPLEYYSRTFPANHIGGGLYEYIIPSGTVPHINPQWICNLEKKRLVFLTRLLCIYGNPVFCGAFGFGAPACAAITANLQLLCSNGLDEAVEEVMRLVCTALPNGVNLMKLTPYLDAMPIHSIYGESVEIDGISPLPNLSIDTYFDCEIELTLNMSNIETTSATATVTTNGLSLFNKATGVCYSSSNNNPTIENGGSVEQSNTYGIVGNSSTTLPLTNLTANTEYHIRPFVKRVIMNEVFYVYGEVQTFTTESQPMIFQLDVVINEKREDMENIWSPWESTYKHCNTVAILHNPDVGYGIAFLPSFSSLFDDLREKDWDWGINYSGWPNYEPISTTISWHNGFSVGYPPMPYHYTYWDGFAFVWVDIKFDAVITQASINEVITGTIQMGDHDFYNQKATTARGTATITRIE